MVKRRGFGKVRRLPSKRYQASYVWPPGTGKRYTAPHTFDTSEAAAAWLRTVETAISEGTWTPAVGQGGQMVAAATRFADFAEKWLSHGVNRTRRPLKPRTAEHYRRLLDRLLLPTFGDTPIKAITVADVYAWHDKLDRDTPTLNAHAYSLLATIMKAAASPRYAVIERSPCDISDAASAQRKRDVKPATLTELAALVEALPERYRCMTLIAAWCGLRYGELTELRRSDIDLTNGIIRVRRGVVRTDSGFKVGTPKSDAGIRDVAIPPHLLPVVKEHLRSHVNGRDGLLFPARDGVSHMAPSALYRVFYPAREKAGRPDLRFHDLRHTGAVLAAATGATLAELMARLGHSTAGAALRYQHAAAGADKRIAARLSEIAGGGI